MAEPGTVSDSASPFSASSKQYVTSFTDCLHYLLQEYESLQAENGQLRVLLKHAPEEDPPVWKGTQSSIIPQERSSKKKATQISWESEPDTSDTCDERSSKKKGTQSSIIFKELHKAHKQKSRATTSVTGTAHVSKSHTSVPEMTCAVARYDHRPYLPNRTDDLESGIPSKKDRTSRQARVHQAIAKLKNARSGDLSMIRGCFIDVAESKIFDSIVAMLILVNITIMAWGANRSVTKAHEPEPEWLEQVEVIFFILYWMELAVRFIGQGSGFMSSDDRYWNLFDLGLAIQSTYEVLVIGLLDSRARVGNAYILRVLRVVKMLKMLRVLKLLRSMRQMRLILFSLIASLNGMLWTLVLVVAVLFMFSLAFVQGCGQFLRSKNATPDDFQSLKNHWGSIGDAMLILMQSVTGGVNWAVVAEPLLQFGTGYYMLFCFYVIFFLCCVLNIITGLFVETTLQKAQHDTQWNIQHELYKKAEYIESLHALFAEMDCDNDGIVTLAQFSAHAGDPILVAFASSLGIEMTDAANLFALYSSNGTQTIDLDTFVTGCIRLKGQPLAIDVQNILVKQKALQQNLDDFIDWSERHILRLEYVLLSSGQETKFVQAVSAKSDSDDVVDHPSQSFTPELACGTQAQLQAKQIML